MNEQQIEHMRKTIEGLTRIDEDLGPEQLRFFKISYTLTIEAQDGETVSFYGENLEHKREISKIRQDIARLQDRLRDLEEEED